MIRRARISNIFCRQYSISEKYHARLTAKAQAEGLTVDELVLKYRTQQQPIENSKQLKTKTGTKTAAGTKTGSEKVAESGTETAADVEIETKPSKETSSHSDVRPKAERISKLKSPERASLKPTTFNLDTFMRSDMLRLHHADEISMLWHARFVNEENVISGSMDAKAFTTLYVNARKNPLFVVPVAHENGIELQYIQWQFVSSETIYCLITSLADYKLHGEFSQPHTTFMLHSNFLMDKQLVLTNAKMEKAVMSIPNLNLLILNIQRFYTAANGSEKHKLITEFNSGNPAFTIDRLTSATDTLD